MSGKLLRIVDYLNKQKMARVFLLIQEVRKLNKEVEDYNRYMYPIDEEDKLPTLNLTTRRDEDEF